MNDREVPLHHARPRKRTMVLVLASAATGAAGVDARIKAVVAEGATGRTAADKAWLVEEFGLAGGVQRALDVITYGLIDVMTPASTPNEWRCGSFPPPTTSRRWMSHPMNGSSV